MAAEPAVGVAALQHNAMESIVTSALVPHRNNSRTLQAACHALTWLLRDGAKGDAALRAAKLGLPKVISEVAFSKLSSEPLTAVCMQRQPGHRRHSCRALLT